MKERNNSERTVGRREVIKGAATAGLVVATRTHALTSADETKSAQRDFIRRENTKPGTRDWLLTKTRTDPKKITPFLTSGSSPSIEGYCSANSVRAGEKLQIMVSTNPASAFKLEIFRTGYYNGDGARLVRSFDSLQGTPQPDPPVGENYLRECQWESAVEFSVGFVAELHG